MVDRPAHTPRRSARAHHAPQSSPEAQTSPEPKALRPQAALRAQSTPRPQALRPSSKGQCVPSRALTGQSLQQRKPNPLPSAARSLKTARKREARCPWHARLRAPRSPAGCSSTSRRQDGEGAGRQGTCIHSCKLRRATGASECRQNSPALGACGGGRPPCDCSTAKGHKAHARACCCNCCPAARRLASCARHGAPARTWAGGAAVPGRETTGAVTCGARHLLT
jgi:hypothetical protein